MSYSTIIIWLLILIVVIAVVAYLLRKAGFTVNKIKAMIPGVVEVEAERSSGTPPDSASSTGSPAQFTQEATDGGEINKARIKAPADSSAGASQKASGKDSKLDDVKIELE